MKYYDLYCHFGLYSFDNFEISPKQSRVDSRKFYLDHNVLINRFSHYYAALCPLLSVIDDIVQALCLRPIFSLRHRLRAENDFILKREVREGTSSLVIDYRTSLVENHLFTINKSKIFTTSSIEEYEKEDTVCTFETSLLISLYRIII